MKQQFIIGNWKSHKTSEETEEWFTNFARESGFLPKEKEIIICPPFGLLESCWTLGKKYASFVKIGAQDVSQFPEGAYTGEVSGKLIKFFATHVIIGHSERRQYFHETDEILAKKVLQAQANLLEVIYCVSDLSQPIPQGVRIAAYEPIDAIGTGNAADPEKVEKIARSLKDKNGVVYILYGGSVAPSNVSTYTKLPSIDGVLVGGASLDPQEFTQIIQHA